MKRVRHVVLFVAIIILISVITGFIYGINNSYDLTDYLTSLSKHNNLFLNNLLIILIFLVSTLSILGVVFQIFIIGFESVSIGYVLSLFFLNYKLKGLLYGLITVLINKFVFILVLLYLLITSYLYIRKSFNNLIGLNKDYFVNIVMPVIYKYIIIFIFVIIYDCIIYFFGNIFLNYLTFML